VKSFGARVVVGVDGAVLDGAVLDGAVLVGTTDVETMVVGRMTGGLVGGGGVVGGGVDAVTFIVAVARRVTEPDVAPTTKVWPPAGVDADVRTNRMRRNRDAVERN
jgi:hypothetical protein